MSARHARRTISGTEHWRLNHSKYTLAAIDDIVARGALADRHAVRDATRDHLDFAVLSDRLGVAATPAALRPFDTLYPQTGPDCASMQLQIQLARPLPFDLDDIALAEYRQLAVRRQDWETVVAQCQAITIAMFDQASE